MKIKIEIPKMPGRCNFCASTSPRTVELTTDIRTALVEICETCVAAIVGKFQEMKS